MERRNQNRGEQSGNQSRSKNQQRWKPEDKSMTELDSRELDCLEAHGWIVPDVGTFGWWEHPKLDAIYTATQALDITKNLLIHDKSPETSPVPQG